MIYLQLNRLIIYKDSEVVYDEVFHKGVNIIRGENGSGKSTISNFIYFVLGGDFVEWLPEAKKCDSVYAEVIINDSVISLRRKVSMKQMQPMDIYHGELNRAVNFATQGWLTFPYSKSKNKESFSQYLFNLLNYPQVSTEENASITINQVLRLLYIDQLSLPNHLVKNIDFDSPLIRSSVGNLLLGVYDDELLNQQIELRDKKKELSESNKEFRAIRDVYEANNINLDINRVENEIKKLTNELEDINNILSTRNSIQEAVEKNEIYKNIQKAGKDINGISYEIAQGMQYKNRIEREIADSEIFIEELEKQNYALSESSNTREIFGELDIAFCPSCLSKLDRVENDEICKLCKAPISDSDHRGRIERIQYEIRNQIKESELLLKNKSEALDRVLIDVRSLRNQLNVAQRKLDDYILNSKGASIERKYDEQLIKKGEVQNQIETLFERKKTIEYFMALKSRLDVLRNNISDLEEAIKIKISIQRKNLQNALATIQKYAIELIVADGAHESEFVNARYINIDFKSNTFSLNGRDHYSASSLVILKNAIRFAIFFASLELDSMRFPRFILCDNIEDKGMTAPRSQNFQKSVVELAKRFDKQFQIIFTTSMVAEELNIEDYTIGEFYTPNNKSLKGVTSSTEDSIKEDNLDDSIEGDFIEPI